jgi:hypothetical protein
MEQDNSTKEINNNQKLNKSNITIQSDKKNIDIINNDIRK